MKKIIGQVILKICKPIALKITLLAICVSPSIAPISNAQVLQIVKEINTTGLSNSYPFDFTIANNQLFFIATGNSGTYGLWITTGTDAGTQMISPSTGPLNNIADIVAFNNKIFFTYNDGINGYELWISDGTAAGTILFKDLFPGSTGSFPSAFTVTNNKLFFMGNSPDGERRLFVSDGTPAGTVVIKNNYINLFNGMSDFAILTNDIYFTSDNGSGTGYGLWKSNGTSGGTILLKPDIIPGTTGGNYAVLNNKLYFSGFDYTNGSELWVSDGTLAGTNMVKNLGTDAGGILYSGAPNYMTVYNNKIYFSASDDLHGNELFVTDGTAAGTQIVKDIVPGTDGSLPFKSIVYNGLLYFSAGGPSAGLWKSDGTDAGTVVVKTGIFDTQFPMIWNGKLFMISTSGGFNNVVWQTDGSTVGTTPIQLQNTSNPVYSLNNGLQFKEYNGAVYLSASCNGITIGYELAKITTGALPLRLISFSGIVKEDKDVLNWMTADEINTAHFIIQQSINGITFSSIATVPASGNTLASSSYHYTLASSQNPDSYYRLKMVDKDEKFTYSPVIKLKHTTKSGLSALYNDSNKQVIIRNNALANCNWKLFSMNGSLVKQGTSSEAIINISTGKITAGTYLLSCKTLNDTESVRFVIF